jgi:competence protein ComGF
MTEQIQNNIYLTALICFIVLCVISIIATVIIIALCISLKKRITYSLDLADEKIQDAPSFVTSLMPFLAEMIAPRRSGILNKIRKLF